MGERGQEDSAGQRGRGGGGAYIVLVGETDLESKRHATK